MTTVTEMINLSTKPKERILLKEIEMMLDNPNPLTGIYSIYGDYPIEKWKDGRLSYNKLEIMRSVR